MSIKPVYLKLIEDIIETRSYIDMISISDYPEAGHFVTTGAQVGNLGSSKDKVAYFGRIAQVRKLAGSFGSHLLILRHPDNKLRTHENQSFYRVNLGWLPEVEKMYKKIPKEDYRYNYTIAGKYPERGKIIEPKKSDRPLDESPRMKITISGPDKEEVYIV